MIHEIKKKTFHISTLFRPFLLDICSDKAYCHFAKLILLPKTDIEFYASSFQDDLPRGTQFHGSYSDRHLPVSQPSPPSPGQSPHPQAEIEPPIPSQSEFTVAPKKKSSDKQRVYGPTAISSQCAHKPCFLGRTPGPRHRIRKSPVSGASQWNSIPHPDS